MNGILRLGPLMLATDRALALLAIWLFLSLGAVIGARTGSRAARASWIALAIGIVAARIGFVAEHIAAFRIEPWNVIALWQGGFSPSAGIAAAAVTLVALLRWQRATGQLLALLAGLALAHAALVAATTPAPRDLPPALALEQLDGQRFAIDTLRGRPFVLNLWATWCPPCRREMPMLIDVARESQVPILLVNQGERGDRVRSFLRRNALAGDAVRLDPAGSIADALGVRAYPTTLFVDAGGRIVGMHSGELSRAALSAALRDLERRPAPSRRPPPSRQQKSAAVSRDALFTLPG